MVFALLNWYEQNRRPLPWRAAGNEIPNPYHVLLSEIMLQQTRIEVVKDYYRRFLLELPTIRALAECSEEKLMKLWEGLGYYSRARNLQKAAQWIMAQGGKFPQTEEKLLELPGVGPYTAAALASIAFQQPAVAIDGNVLRVLARLFCQEMERDKAKELLFPLIPSDQAAAFTQAWMELGETLCLPHGTPDCSHCPLSSFCLAHKTKRIEEFPAPKKKMDRPVEQLTVLYLLIERQGHQLLCVNKRAAKGLLASLWQPIVLQGNYTEPELPQELKKRGFSAKITDSPLIPIGERRHIFTHKEWAMELYQVKLPTSSRTIKQITLPDGYLWKNPLEIALPSAFRLPD